MIDKENIPLNWKIVSINEITRNERYAIVDGPFGTQMKVHEFVSSGIPLVEMQNINEDKFENTFRRFLTNEKYEEVKRSSVTSGDLIISKTGSLGYVAIVPDSINKAIITSRLAKISVDWNIIEKSYFLNYLLFLREKGYWKKIAKGTTMKILNVGQLADTKIPLPPINEQQHIVSKIDELLSDLENGKQQLQLAQQQLKIYRQSLLKWAFEGKLTNPPTGRAGKNVKDGELPEGWKLVRVGDVCKCIVPNRDKPKSFSGDIKWVTTPNLNSNSIRLEYSKISKGLSEIEAKEYNARIIPVGSVIMTCVGTFGISAVIEKPIIINQQLHAFLSNELINSKYLAYCVQYNKNYFEKKSTSTTIRYLNKGNCNSMPLPLCSVLEQQLIVDELESKLTVCEKIQETISQSLLQAESLKQSILKKAFEGKLV